MIEKKNVTESVAGVALGLTESVTTWFVEYRVVNKTSYGGNGHGMNFSGYTAFSRSKNLVYCGPIASVEYNASALSRIFSRSR